MRPLLLAFLLPLVLRPPEVAASGLFELRVSRFDNPLGRDTTGHCCDGEPATDDLQCGGPCLTSLRVCLKHYQLQVDTESPCTYGDVHSPLLGDRLLNDTYTVKFPFQFTWPGTFSLIVEAWHDVNQTKGERRLLARHTQQQNVDVGATYTPAMFSNGHTSLHYEYRVTCGPNYYGHGCELLCKPRNDEFGHYTCSPQGSIVCEPGWQGDYCTKPKCLPDCLHGNCTKPNECKCKRGWKGPLCNECRPHPGCGRGTCEKPWDCLCEEGWGGLFCKDDLNYCTNNRPCRNGGTCFNTGQGLFTCNCPQGYTGQKCETYLGTPTASCAVLGCLNGATCDQISGLCVCPKGFSGPLCGQKSSSCLNSPCFNGATCETRLPPPGAPDYVCKCAPGFSGQLCEIRNRDCDSQPCLHGGSCVSNEGARVCECVNGYFGKFCENSYQACLTRPCHGAATCSDLGHGAYRCFCPPGRFGRHCDEVRGIVDREYLVVREVDDEVASLSGQQVALVVVLSVLIPVVALAGVASIMLLRRRREVERKAADHLARLQNEANLRASGQRPEMIHNRLRADNHEYATVSHDYAKLNTNRAFLDADNRLSKASLESQQCCQPSMCDSGGLKKSECMAGPSTSCCKDVSCLYGKSGSSIYSIPDTGCDDAVLAAAAKAAGFVATEV
ncbi:neurogenic locus protein delta-like isoform X2 [Neocloeon triangulifer]|uniref:neurogenic locus protein delta-like isoform X2 n=1 Tax=Neocloeon triangulifer TaxID=2078957 RepID=UPI00286F2B85|nr:neurogenic locus protein delta-like isoform X2 [Neocloeon triangulifer]